MEDFSIGQGLFYLVYRTRTILVRKRKKRERREGKLDGMMS